jgi:hypothetical protein
VLRLAERKGRKLTSPWDFEHWGDGATEEHHIGCRKLRARLVVIDISGLAHDATLGRRLLKMIILNRFEVLRETGPPSVLPGQATLLLLRAKAAEIVLGRPDYFCGGVRLCQALRGCAPRA